MSKFNLYKQQKSEKSDFEPNHPTAFTEKQLNEKNKGEKEKNIITEKQLDENRFPVEETTLEGLLEKTRTGSAYSTTEALLDNTKANFDIKFRDESAYSGDINKLEEKRLANNPVEDEKYESLSEVPKKLRWWEGKSPDGLKVANKKKA